jgi:hypothetical protein
MNSVSYVFACYLSVENKRYYYYYYYYYIPCHGIDHRQTAFQTWSWPTGAYMFPEQRPRYPLLLQLVEK